MVEEPTKDEIEEIRMLAVEFLEKLQMAGEAEVTAGEDQLTISIDSGKTDGLLIGRKGETLDAYEHLLRRIVAKKTGYEGRILVDVGGYRERREKRLAELALSLASRVSLSGEPQMTELLSPRERRVIHLALKDHPDVTTEGLGEGSLKRVRIFPRTAEPGQTEISEEHIHPLAIRHRARRSGRVGGLVRFDPRPRGLALPKDFPRWPVQADGV